MKQSFEKLSLIAAVCYLSLLALPHPLVAEDPGPEELAATAKIAEAGGTVRRVAQDVDWNEVSFAFSAKQIGDDSLKHLAEVPSVVWLYLQGTDITDAGLEQVGKLKGLTKLHLEKTKITDEGLQHLANLTELEYLNLYGTQVSNEGLNHLKGLTNLKRLYLWQTKVDEEGLAMLQIALPDTMMMLAAPPLPEIKPLIEPLGVGRYVRVRLQGTERILSLAEVEVFGEDNETPLHSDGTATQSSVAYEGEPLRAIDGNTDAHYENNSVTHTETSSYPWWQVDLGEAKTISRIKIWNRDTYGDRLKGARVEVLDDAHQVVWARGIKEATDSSEHEFPTEEPDAAAAR